MRRVIRITSHQGPGRPEYDVEVDGEALAKEFNSFAENVDPEVLAAVVSAYAVGVAGNTADIMDRLERKFP